MDYYAMSDAAICQMLGERLKALRLRKNKTQQALADDAQLSVGTIKALEQGNGKLQNLVAVLRELGAFDSLDAFLPEPRMSPIGLAQHSGARRKQATGKRKSPRARKSPATRQRRTPAGPDEADW